MSFTRGTSLKSDPERRGRNGVYPRRVMTNSYSRFFRNVEVSVQEWGVRYTNTDLVAPTCRLELLNLVSNILGHFQDSTGLGVLG